MGALGYACSLLAFVCFVLTEIRIFKDKQHAGTVHGILGIVTCGLWAFVWGWIQTKRYHNIVIMLLWTAAMIMSWVFGAAAMVKGILGQPS
jgi:ABC-type uncharacterized transport system permease subunit